jgi:transcriptional regulator with XRE-family HTH domain
MSRFGLNLRALRERAGLTQEALARRMQQKKPAPISLWETGESIPSPKTIERLAKALDCTTMDLLVGVITPYDALRGSTEVLGEIGNVRLTDAEADLVRLWRKVPAEQRPAIVQLIQAVARYGRRRQPVSGSPPAAPVSPSPPADQPVTRKRRSKKSLS